MYCIAGPARTVSASVRAKRNITGTISITSTRGTVPSIELQKVRMPTRVMEINAAMPERMTRTTSAQIAAGRHADGAGAHHR